MYADLRHSSSNQSFYNNTHSLSWILHENIVIFYFFFIGSSRWFVFFIFFGELQINFVATLFLFQNILGCIGRFCCCYSNLFFFYYVFNVRKRKMKEEMVWFENKIHVNLNSATDEQQRRQQQPIQPLTVNAKQKWKVYWM